MQLVRVAMEKDPDTSVKKFLTSSFQYVKSAEAAEIVALVTTTRSCGDERVRGSRRETIAQRLPEDRPGHLGVLRLVAE